MLSLLKLIILKEYINYAMFSSLVLHILLYVLWDKLVAQCLFFFSCLEELHVMFAFCVLLQSPFKACLLHKGLPNPTGNKHNLITLCSVAHYISFIVLKHITAVFLNNTLILQILLNKLSSKSTWTKIQNNLEWILCRTNWYGSFLVLKHITAVLLNNAFILHILLNKLSSKTTLKNIYIQNNLHAQFVGQTGGSVPVSITFFICLLWWSFI